MSVGAKKVIELRECKNCNEIRLPRIETVKAKRPNWHMIYTVTSSCSRVSKTINCSLKFVACVGKIHLELMINNVKLFEQ